MPVIQILTNVNVLIDQCNLDGFTGLNPKLVSLCMMHDGHTMLKASLVTERSMLSCFFIVDKKSDLPVLCHYHVCKFTILYEHIVHAVY